MRPIGFAGCFFVEFRWLGLGARSNGSHALRLSQSRAHAPPADDPVRHFGFQHAASPVCNGPTAPPVPALRFSKHPVRQPCEDVGIFQLVFGIPGRSGPASCNWSIWQESRSCATASHPPLPQRGDLFSGPGVFLRFLSATKVSEAIRVRTIYFFLLSAQFPVFGFFGDIKTSLGFSKGDLFAGRIDLQAGVSCISYVCQGTLAFVVLVHTRYQT